MSEKLFISVRDASGRSQFEPANFAMQSIVDKDENIKRLVELVDQLRQPYNNSKRSDLYWLATNALNLLEETGSIPPLDKIKTTICRWPEDARDYLEES